MNDAPSVSRDERTLAIENASFRWAFLAMSFGLLAVVAYRAFVFRESSWDLMALVVMGGGVGYAYQGLHRVLSRAWIAASLLTLVIAMLLAVAIVVFRR
jgi:hypothetical protein